MELHVIKPPYHELQPLEIFGSNLVRGSVLVVEAHSDDSAKQISRQVQQLRATTLPYALVVWLHRLSVPDQLNAALAGLRSGASTATEAPSLTSDVLRDRLTAREIVPAALTNWLTTIKAIRDPLVIGAISGMIQTDRNHWYFDDTDKRQKVRLQRLFNEAGLASPTRWKHYLRVVLGSIEVQRAHASSLDTIAGNLGYYDGAALRRRLAAVIGCTATDIRRFLGWEWVAIAALRRSGL